MASLILKMSVSLDGFVEPRDERPGWNFAGTSEDSRDWVLETISNAGAHLIGAGAYAQFSAYWPTAPGPFAKPMNEIPKVVFSNSLTTTEWGPATIVTGDLAENVARLKQEHEGGYLLAQAGTRFAQSLVETGLVDEYRLAVHPVILGEGERLFSTPLDIETISTTVFSAGAVGHVFRAHPVS